MVRCPGWYKWSVVWIRGDADNVVYSLTINFLRCSLYSEKYLHIHRYIIFLWNFSNTKSNTDVTYALSLGTTGEIFTLINPLSTTKLYFISAWKCVNVCTIEITILCVQNVRILTLWICRERKYFMLDSTIRLYTYIYVYSFFLGSRQEVGKKF